MIYEKILIATDGSELASRAVAHGLTLARTQGPRRFRDRGSHVVGLGDRTRSEARQGQSD